MQWRVAETRKVEKQLRRLPKNIQLIYRGLCDDIEQGGPTPFGWDSRPLKGYEDHYRITLAKKYRVIIHVVSPSIIVVKVAHRKDVYR
ncbi:MAG: hypothetical protein A3F16_02110 [Deltaproteobacteria bacterium RIFCSPHIGHO2_12_FULL_43_9]|nr:MAG: hypothetical protein A3F16_02110 [Deltaproteobacteria bacterium RIFCSPHIGHO2_12_FULL_43_9]